jgi:hypothetical protein
MPTRTRDLTAIDIRGRLMALSRSKALGRRIDRTGEDHDEVPAGRQAQEREAPAPEERH